ncbi:MAG: carboxypeptidase-like regulatory domain-containing protein [Bacteroidetes bacterium]|nr:carboxypeptidase-like regulatory domain-containing protein [Bacteroidota bacterium]
MKNVFILAFISISAHLLIGTFAFSQDKDLIQFSGVIVENDSLKPVPFTKVIIKSSGRGTLADFYGYFSFVAQKKDTIIFSGIGYKKSQFIIPDTLSGNKYSLIQVLHFDTILLKETIIYPWPTREQFKEVFLNMKVPDDDLARAKKNLDREEMKEQYENMGMDGSMNYKASQQQYQSRLYWAGQYPPNNLLNPFAWAQFVKMWREGKLKIKPGNEDKEK